MELYIKDLLRIYHQTVCTQFFYFIKKKIITLFFSILYRVRNYNIRSGRNIIILCEKHL